MMVHEFEMLSLLLSVLPAPFPIVARGSRASHKLVDSPPWIKLASSLQLCIHPGAQLCKAYSCGTSPSGPTRSGKFFVVLLNLELQPLPSAEKLAPSLKLLLNT
nr:uncharacterized protein CTRU02_14559 [Colletotrichum truncatum]KAF6782003.1 hypothetical protein CTRU02_14559 [Colletotrichum truncatum]